MELISQRASKQLKYSFLTDPDLYVCSLIAFPILSASGTLTQSLSFAHFTVKGLAYPEVPLLALLSHLAQMQVHYGFK